VRPAVVRVAVPLEAPAVLFHAPWEIKKRSSTQQRFYRVQ
jgi:hypothetical protein